MPEVDEETRLSFFADLDDEVPLGIQMALINEHDRLQRSIIEETESQSLPKLFVIIGSEALKPGNFKNEERREARSLKALFSGTKKPSEVKFQNDGHVGTILTAIAAGSSIIPDGISSQQLNHAGRFLLAAAGPYLPRHLKTDVSERGFGLTPFARGFREREDITNAFLISSNLKLAKTLQHIADRCPKELEHSKTYFEGMAAFCQISAAEVLNEFCQRKGLPTPRVPRTPAPY